MYKILALDLDGTLTDSNKKITPKTKETIDRFLEAGYVLALASGRPTPGVLSVAKELELEKYDSYMLSYNGGRIQSCKTGKVISQKTLEEDIVEDLFAYADELGIGMISYNKEGIVASMHEDEFIDIEAKINHLPVVHTEDPVALLDEPVNKCLGTAPVDIAPEIEEKFSKKFGNRIGVGRSEPFFIELVPQGVDKAESLEILCKSLGCTKENLVACGDGFNDLSMIEYAGMGVAMANAQDAVKEKADYITASNDEDGVAKVIEKFFEV